MTTTVRAPVAAVVVDTPLAHLDREFEYAVPPDLDEAARPGVRVRVRFAGRDLAGFVVARRERAEHLGALAPLRTVVSPESVLTPEILAVCREVARRHAGTLSDVLRLAVPQRHAAAERALTLRPPPEPGPITLAVGAVGPWADYPAGPPFLTRIGAGQPPAASWLALPGRAPEGDWPTALAVAAGWALRAERGALLVLPDHRDVARVDAALAATLGPGRHVRLTADQGPQARYTAWLSVLRGHVRCVVGTRAAAFAPVRDLGLVCWWDDGDDLHEEPRAPYAHVGEVLRLRAERAGAALLSGGFTRTVRQQLAIADGLDRQVAADPATVRSAAPRVLIAGERDEERDGAAARAHLPSLAWRTAQHALTTGPVLVQVPRRGYLPSLRCQDCRELARCPRCHGPMAQPGAGEPAACRLCGSSWGIAGFVCPHCQGRRLRSGVVGARRTAEELGRAFPGMAVHMSGAGEVLATVGSEAALVIATPGAEPVADGGYAATLLLDAWALLDRSSLDAPVEALRRWAGAGALTRRSDAGGVLVLCGAPADVTLPPVEALVRWDPGWLAGRELDERRELGLPPAVSFAQIVGTRAAVAEIAHELLAAAPWVDLLGPLPLHVRPGGRSEEGPELVRLLARVPRAARVELSARLSAIRVVRSAHKASQPVTVRFDTADAW